jgi:hypothetical protein
MAGQNPYLMRIGARESGGNYGAQSRTSSAGGKYQFTDATWLATIRRARPDLKGATDRELLKLKTDTSDEGRLIQEQAAEFYLQNDVIPSLTKQGIEPTQGNVYLAWFAGPAGAAKVLKSDPNTPVREILGDKVIEANKAIRLGDKPFEQFTSSDLTTWAGSKGTGAAPYVKASLEGEESEQPETEETTADVLDETIPTGAPVGRSRDIANLARYYQSMDQSRGGPLLEIPNLMAARQQEQESQQGGIASLFPYG